MKKTMFFLNLLALLSGASHVFGAASASDWEPTKPLILSNRTNHTFFLLPQYFKTKDKKPVDNSAYISGSTSKKTKILPGEHIAIKPDEDNVFRMGTEDDKDTFLYVELDKKTIGIPFDKKGYTSLLRYAIPFDLMDESYVPYFERNLLENRFWEGETRLLYYPKAFSIVETGDSKRPFEVKLNGDLTPKEVWWEPADPIPQKKSAKKSFFF